MQENDDDGGAMMVLNEWAYAVSRLALEVMPTLPGVMYQVCCQVGYAASCIKVPGIYGVGYTMLPSTQRYHVQLSGLKEP